MLVEPATLRRRASEVRAKNNCHFVYRLYDKRNVLLYIGVTGNVSARMGQHRKDKWWWGFVDHRTVAPYRTRTAADAAEAHAIRREGAVFNQNGRPSTEGYQLDMWYRLLEAMHTAAGGRLKEDDIAGLFRRDDVPRWVVEGALAHFNNHRSRGL